MGCNRLLTEIFRTCCLEIQKKIPKTPSQALDPDPEREEKNPKIRWMSSSSSKMCIDFICVYNSLSSNQPCFKNLGMTIRAASGISCPCSNSYESLERSSSPDACRDHRYP